MITQLTPTPGYVTQVDVNFENKPVDVVVLLNDDGNGNKVVLLWNRLTLEEQKLLDEMFNDYSTSPPQVADFSPKQKVYFHTPFSESRTDLLVTENNPNWNDRVTHAYTSLAFGSAKQPTDPTGLANDNTQYKLELYVDGTIESIVVTGSNVQTWLELFTTLSAGWTATQNSQYNDVAAGLHDLVFFSSTLGPASTIEIITSTDTLLKNLNGFPGYDKIITQRGTGRSVPYYVKIKVDSWEDTEAEVPEQTITIPLLGPGENGLGYTTDNIMTIVNNQLTSATAAISLGVTPDTLTITGDGAVATMKVEITDDNLFKHLSSGKVTYSYPRPYAFDTYNILWVNGKSGISRDQLYWQVYDYGSLNETLRDNIILVGAKPTRGAYDTSQVYWDGTNWKRLIDDTVIV